MMRVKIHYVAIVFNNGRIFHQKQLLYYVVHTYSKVLADLK